jgi:methionine synthase II (cobalamin-independent)
VRDLPTGVATGVGSMPGEDIVEATRVVLGELPDFPHLAEVPGRSESASMLGRSLAMLTDLAVDLQPAGWRLTDAPGADQRRARSLLAQDLDTLEELAQGLRGPLKVQVAGPWTLAATVERPRGDKVLADHGARRELAQSMAEGLGAHLRDVGRRVPGAHLVLQVDEPALPAVLAAEIPTASGFGRHRAIHPPEAVEALGGYVETAGRRDASTVVHCCARRLPLETLTKAGASAVSVDLGLVAEEEYDGYAAALDQEMGLWLGVVPAVEPARPPAAEAVADRVRRLVSRLGFDPDRAGDLVVLTPSCGLSGATPRWAREALRTVREAARQLSVEDGRMVP